MEVPQHFGPRNSNKLYIISIKTSAYAEGRKEFKAALNRKYLCPRKTFAKFAKSRKKTQDKLLPTVSIEKIF
jgi:hypothetical protein